MAGSLGGVVFYPFPPSLHTPLFEANEHKNTPCTQTLNHLYPRDKGTLEFINMLICGGTSPNMPLHGDPEPHPENAPVRNNSSQTQLQIWTGILGSMYSLPRQITMQGDTPGADTGAESTQARILGGANTEQEPAPYHRGLRPWLPFLTPRTSHNAVSALPGASILSSLFPSSTWCLISTSSVGHRNSPQRMPSKRSPLDLPHKPDVSFYPGDLKTPCICRCPCHEMSQATIDLTDTNLEEKHHALSLDYPACPSLYPWSSNSARQVALRTGKLWL